MIRSIVRYTIFFAAMLLLGPVAWWLTGTLRGNGGEHLTSPFVSTAGAIGLLRAAAAVGLAFAAGFVARMFVSPRWAMFTAGGVLTWAAWGAGSIDGLLRASRDGSPLPRLAVEGLAYTLLAAATAYILGRPRAHVPGHDTVDEAKPTVALAGLGLAIGVGAGLLCAWVVAQSTMKGQLIAAAALAGLTAALAAHVLSPRLPAWSLVTGITALGIAGPMIALAIEPAGAALVYKANGGQLFPIARLLPIDWLAGAFLGVPLGHAWGASLAESRASGQPRAARPA